MCFPCVYILILSNNRCADVLACINSLYKNGNENVKIVMLDNASTDGSVNAVRAKYPEVEILLLNDLTYHGKLKD